MKNKKIIEYNEQLKPFYIVDLGEKYSLCLYINGLDEDYGQPAFDNYAKARGEPIRDKDGYVTYGTGEEWMLAFTEYFKEDENLKNVSFDCENSLFACTGNELETLVDFGKGFKEVCEDNEKFTELVERAMEKAKQNLEENDITDLKM